jgi:hypothetical protein
MLTTLSLEKFKSWKQIDAMRLAPITGLFGANSSGKTSILQLLLMLKQTAESPDRNQVLNFGDERSLTTLGTFREVVYRHEKPGTLRWALSWIMSEKLEVPDPTSDETTLFSGDEMRFEAKVTESRSGRVIVDKFAYRFAQHDFGMEREGSSETKYRLFSKPEEFQFRRPLGRLRHLLVPVKCYGFPDPVRASYMNAGFLADFELAFEELFARIYYLGPLREYPKRQYIWAGSEPADMGQRGERVVDALLAARARGTLVSSGPGHGRMTLEAYAALRLRELGLIHDFSVKVITEGSSLYQVFVQQSPDAAQVLITDVGFGVSQVLPVLVLCYYVPEGSTILLEQPEIHLHPSVQAGLADVFIDAVKRRRIQIILESHSEHLLRRLQRRIAEEHFSPDDAALYFCSTVNGTSQLTPLQIDVFGNISNWPEGFFGDEFGEMAAMSQAMIDRKRRQSA